MTAKQWKKLTLLHIIVNVSCLCPGHRREEKERILNLEFFFFPETLKDQCFVLFIFSLRKLLTLVLVILKTFLILSTNQ